MLGILGLYIATFVVATINFSIVGSGVFILNRYFFQKQLSRMFYAWVYFGCLILSMISYILIRQQVLQILVEFGK